jgi:hypothetical protein
MNGVTFILSLKGLIQSVTEKAYCLLYTHLYGHSTLRHSSLVINNVDVIKRKLFSSGYGA